MEKIIKKEDLRKSLVDYSNFLDGLINLDGVRSDSCLYGMLVTAHVSLSLAISHYNEFVDGDK